MTDWRAAGHLADARRVARMVGSRYISWPKDVGRRRIIRALRDVLPELVLDLWGGGVSATAMTAEGFNVLSVDDGRSFDEFGVSTERGRQALATLSAHDGYDEAWGDAIDYAQRCDAAFLDFMGHWSPEVKRTLMACRHMKAVAVTLMPERTPLGRLDEEDWEIAYRGFLENALQMKVRWWYAYRRNEKNQRATVFFLRPEKQGRPKLGPRTCMDCPTSLRGMPAQTRRCPECRKARARTRLRNGQTPGEYGRRYRAREAERRRNRGPIEKAHVAQQQRERYANDPEYRERMKANALAQHRRKKMAAVSGTAAEAITD